MSPGMAHIKTMAEGYRSWVYYISHSLSCW